MGSGRTPYCGLHCPPASHGPPSRSPLRSNGPENCIPAGRCCLARRNQCPPRTREALHFLAPNGAYDRIARLMPAMNCRLCGQPKAVPEKLCGDCAAALAHAREGSAAVRKLTAPRATRVAAAAATVARRPTTLRPAALRDRRRQVAGAVVALAAIGMAYLGQRAADRPQGFDAAVVADRSPMPWSERPKIAAAPIPARQETRPSTAGVTIGAVPAPPAGLRTTDRLDGTQGSILPRRRRPRGQRPAPGLPWRRRTSSRVRGLRLHPKRRQTTLPPANRQPGPR